MSPRERIIIALDVDTPEKAIELVEELSPYVGCFKIGLEFINRMVSSLVLARNESEAVKKLRIIRRLFKLLAGKIFWDDKLSDIPNTVAGASLAISEMDVRMLNVHASCGIKGMQAAVKNKGQALVLAVTILTSLKAQDLFDLGYPSEWPCVESIASYYGYNLDGHAYLQPLVARMARCAKDAGCDGIICSPQELDYLNTRSGPSIQSLIKVTPGVRPLWASTDDQKRVMTPGEAIKAGADYLVIGRPATNPPAKIGSRVHAVRLITEEIAEAAA